MRPILVLGFSIALLATSAVHADVARCLSGEAEEWLEATGIPGLSLAMRAASGERLALAVGDASPVEAVPLTTSHRLRIASLSKPLTALTILSLVEAGRLELESPVFGARGVLGGRWPELDRARWLDRLSVRHLLEHGGGLGGWQRDPMFTLGDDATPRDELIEAALTRYPPVSRPGREFRYANVGYLILGEVIESVSGRSYEDQVRESVLIPAGIEGMRIGRIGREGRLPDEAAYAGEAAYLTVRPDRFGPFGGWVATPNELLDLLDWIDRPGASGLAAATRLRMLRSSAPRHPGGAASAYGLGWEVDRSGYGHFGAMPGTQALMRRQRSGAAWVAIANGLPAEDPEGLRLERMLQRAHDRCMR